MARKKKQPPVEKHTLAGKLTLDGVTDAPERVRWLLMTWDLAKTGDAQWYTRIFLTNHGYGTFNGPRSPKLFDRKDPSRGAAGSGSSRQDTLAALQAQEYTERKMGSGGYALVCCPLAIDLFHFAPRISDAYRPDAGLLLMELKRKTELGLEVLAHVNTVRYDALETHLSPCWEKHFTHETTDLLWDGRGPKGRRR